MVKNKRWYQYWQSWLVVALLLFLPTFLIGVILMWFIAPWSKTAKILVTIIFPTLILIPLIILFSFTLFPQVRGPITPTVSLLPQYTDAQKRENIAKIRLGESNFYQQYGRYSTSIDELKNGGFIEGLELDSTYTYTQTKNGADCIISTALSSGEKSSSSCRNGLILDAK